MGCLRPNFSILGHVAASHQHRHNYRHLPMVFLIQNTQNRDGAAVPAKLDELIRVTAASNSFIGIEHLTVEEVNEFRAKCKAAAGKAGSAAVKKASAKARKAADKAA